MDRGYLQFLPLERLHRQTLSFSLPIFESWTGISRADYDDCQGGNDKEGEGGAERGTEFSLVNGEELAAVAEGRADVDDHAKGNEGHADWEGSPPLGHEVADVNFLRRNSPNLAAMKPKPHQGEPGSDPR